MSLLKTKIAKKISLSIILILSFSYELKAGEVMVWDCNKFENARIVGEDGTYLGKLRPSWMNESIFNSFLNTQALGHQTVYSMTQVNLVTLIQIHQFLMIMHQIHPK